MEDILTENRSWGNGNADIWMLLCIRRFSLLHLVLHYVPLLQDDNLSADLHIKWLFCSPYTPWLMFQDMSSWNYCVHRDWWRIWPVINITKLIHDLITSFKNSLFLTFYFPGLRWNYICKWMFCCSIAHMSDYRFLNLNSTWLEVRSKKIMQELLKADAGNGISRAYWWLVSGHSYFTMVSMKFLNLLTIKSTRTYGWRGQSLP